jgi:hypothetical protein
MKLLDRGSTRAHAGCSGTLQLPKHLAAMRRPTQASGRFRHGKQRAALSRAAPSPPVPAPRALLCSRFACMLAHHVMEAFGSIILCNDLLNCSSFAPAPLSNAPGGT